MTLPKQVVQFTKHLTKMGSSKLIIKSISQKQMVESSFERKFHDLKLFEGRNLFFIFIECIINLRASPIFLFVKNHQFDVILIMF